MEVTCPKGHKIEIMDPAEYETIVAVDTSGTDLVGVIEVPETVSVKCNAGVGGKSADGRALELCGETFEAVVS
jgi:hypothetical protein